MTTILEGVNFSDADRAAAGLSTILEGAAPTLRDHLEIAFREAADAMRALVRLERFLERSMYPGTHLGLMAATPHYARMLVILFDQSHFLTDILCRNPEYASWLWEEASLLEPVSSTTMADELGRHVATLSSFEARCNSMRRYKRREILRIAARDVFRHAAISSVTEDLSNLADASLQTAFVCAREDLAHRFGEPREEGGQSARFVVMGMGKLGGRELNFSSDIDLIFLYSHDGETTGGSNGRLSNVEYYQRLGERIIKAMSENLAEGHVFRVDMRLRPHGRMGPLVVGLDSALHYYESQGRAWERQALIKARPCAGATELGEDFIARARPFVFPRYFDDATLEDVRQVKLQMEAQVQQRGETEIEVKLGKGGIRDIEFTVQMLQLLNGGRIEALRVRSTLEAIRALGEHGLLRPFDAQTLASNYSFLREVEHRLQIEGSQQLHVLPSNPAAMDDFGRRLGYESGEAFMRTYRERTESSREILVQFVASKGAGNLWINDLLNPASDAADGQQRLAAMGFSDPARARDELLRLGNGSREKPHTLRVRQLFAEVAPTLLEALASASDPDSTLVRLEQILSKLSAPAGLYDTLKYNPEFAGYLVSLVANSEFLAQLLLRDPGLFDVFGRSGALERPLTRNELLEQLAALSNAHDSSAAPHRLYAGEMLRIGMRDLVGEADVLEVGRELTLLAEVCLDHAWRVARARVAARHGEAEGDLVILGVGKFGGRELGYGSDLDLIFVYPSSAKVESGMAASEYFASVAAATIKELKEPTRHGTLYDVDARLRPDGKKGVLAISDARLEDYYSNEAQAWERLALMKARAVGGDVAWARDVESLARRMAFEKPFSAEDIEHVESLRRRLVAGATELELKKAEGGLIDIEFSARLMQQRHCREHPEIRRGDVEGALAGLERAGAFASADARALFDAYVFYRRIENRIRMMNGRSGSALPESADARVDLARRLAIDGDLLDLVAERKLAVHRIYEGVLRRLLTVAPEKGKAG